MNESSLTCVVSDILYGNLITLGFFKCAGKARPAVKVHPGFGAGSIGYNAESGQ
jgi:hypothetical protein